MEVLIGTTNPAKIEGARLALMNYFKDEDINIDGIKVNSLVPEQPINDEVYLGAINRVDNLIKYAKENNIKADLYIAIESGLMCNFDKWFNYNIAVVKNNDGLESVGMGPVFPIPNKFIDEIKTKSLGVVFDEIFNANNLHVGKGGINSLTHEGISRIDVTKQAFIMALTGIVNDYWQD